MEEKAKKGQKKGPFKDGLSIKGSTSAKDQGKRGAPRHRCLPPHLQPAATSNSPQHLRGVGLLGEKRERKKGQKKVGERPEKVAAEVQFLLRNEKSLD